MNDRRPFTITCVRRDPCHGHWTAHVTINGHVSHVDRRYGSWHLTRGTTRADLRPEIAAALQARVRPLEKAERRDTVPGIGSDASQLALEGAA